MTIELSTAATPNGYKVLMSLEEAGIEHRIEPVNISRGTGACGSKGVPREALT